jgi:hypothetical protein
MANSTRRWLARERRAEKYVHTSDVLEILVREKFEFIRKISRRVGSLDKAERLVQRRVLDVLPGYCMDEKIEAQRKVFLEIEKELKK